MVTDSSKAQNLRGADFGIDDELMRSTFASRLSPTAAMQGKEDERSEWAVKAADVPAHKPYRVLLSSGSDDDRYVSGRAGKMLLRIHASLAEKSCLLIEKKLDRPAAVPSLL